MVLKYSWISFWFSLRKLRKLMACFRLDQTPSSRPGTAALIFCTRLEPRAAGLSSDRWLIGFSWGFFPYTRRKHACLPAVSSPHISTHSPHLCCSNKRVWIPTWVLVLSYTRLRLLNENCRSNFCMNHMYLHQETLTSVLGQLKLKYSFYAASQLF